MVTSRFRKYGKKRSGRRRRNTRRTNRVYRTLRSRNVYFYNRYAFQQAPQTALTTDANGQFFGAMFAQGIDLMYTDITSISLPNRSEFTSLYDQYKILSYTIEIRPRMTDYSRADSSTYGHCPTIYWVYDQDDATAPTAMSSIMEHPKVRSSRLTKPVFITVKYPTISVALWNGGVTTAYGAKKAMWLDCNSYQVPHYGVKYAIQAAPTTDLKGYIDIRVKWRLAFKNPR